ncbi:MAG: hypothetical protein ABR985_22070 [Methanotrichaceae archaeon]|jgi:hypothetical protein
MAYKRSIPQLIKEDKDKLEKLKEQIEWQQISWSEYHEFEDKLKYEMYDKANWDGALEKFALMNKFLSSYYVLEFVKKYGFKRIIYRIHEMIGWDRCWALGENAIESGIIKEEADLECAEELVRFHRSVEDGNRLPEEEDDEDNGDI